MSLLDEVLREMETGQSLGAAFARQAWPNGVPEEGRAATGNYNQRASVTRDGIVGTRTLITDSTGDTPAAGVFVSPESPLGPVNVVPAVRFGDLFPRLPTRSNLVAYVRELNPLSLEGGASATAEGAAKPEAEVDFTGGTMPVGKFAVWLPATQEILDDVPALQDFVDRRLLDMVRVREEAELLSGDGTGSNITGLRNTAGVQTQSFSTSVEKTIALAMAKVTKVYGAVDAIAIDQDSFWTSFAAAPTFWSGITDSLRLRVVVMSSNVMGASKAMVGSFAQGATIRERSTSAAFSTDTPRSFSRTRSRSGRRGARRSS